MSYNPPNTSRRMPRHIRGFCVTSARKFKMINDPRRPNKKENGRTSANSVHVLRVLELITQAWKKFEYGFCRWHYNKIYKTFSEILPRLNFEAKIFSTRVLYQRVCIWLWPYVSLDGFMPSFKWNWWFKVVAKSNFRFFRPKFLLSLSASTPIAIEGPYFEFPAIIKM